MNVLSSDDSYNKKWELRESHNCYSYLLNLKSLEAEKLCMKEYKDLNYCRRSQPGYAAGYGVMDKKNLTCPEVMKRTLADNPLIKPTTFEQPCDMDSYKGALVVDPGNDYHYYRLNDDGYWTHKAGYKPSSVYDAKGDYIYNPEKASRNYGRLNYSDFCGYFCVPRQPTKKRMYHKPLTRDTLKHKGNRNIQPRKRGQNKNTNKNNNKNTNNNSNNNKKRIRIQN